MSGMGTLIHGPKGHPLHPPLTDAAIGAYTVAAVLMVVGALGFMEDATGKGAWLALLVGLAASTASALTGVADLLTIDRDSPTFRTALYHGLVMSGGTVLFVLAAIFQYDGFHDGRVTSVGLVFVLAGFALLTVGGWLGGTVVFVHGMRVESEPDEPTREAVKP